MKSEPGCQLCLADTGEPICETCGQRHAPALAALACLADSARRISRTQRNNVFPPLSALLELANAAERYSLSTPEMPQARVA
jgi:hypothetical protein